MNYDYNFHVLGSEGHNVFYSDSLALKIIMSIVENLTAQNKY